MRRVFILSPYFPPQSRVGALRPLKFARHLPSLGWEPVILTDLWPGAKLSHELMRAVPQDLQVIRDYSRRAQPTAQKLAQQPNTTQPKARKTQAAPWWERRIPQALRNPELVPLGEHSVHMPHALKAARRILSQQNFDALMVNADPYATMLVGAKLASETGLPLIQDLRDPWSVCELRRPRRPAPIRKLVDRMERYAVQAASRVILNTETTLRDYRRHYRDLPAEHFTCIRNHSDATLIASGQAPDFSRFTLLFLGGFRRFVEGDVLVRILAELVQRGIDKEALQLVVTGTILDSTRAMAQDLGVSSMLIKHTPVPYDQIGPVMNAADVLVALNNRTVQRIPAKIYDYATTQRPMLVMADNPELKQMMERHAGVMLGLDQVDAAADQIQAWMAKGRRLDVQRDAEDLSSQVASSRLAAILNECVDS